MTCAVQQATTAAVTNVVHQAFPVAVISAARYFRLRVQLRRRRRIVALLELLLAVSRTVVE